jgi:tripeptidyl-peptidase I
MYGSCHDAISSPLPLFSLFGGALSVSFSDYAVKDAHHVPRSFSWVRPAPKYHLVNLKIGLRQSKFDELENHLYEVSDPYHERYGQHLSAEEVNELIKPSGETTALVRTWLEEHGISDGLEASPAGDWLEVRLPVGAVEDLLNTEYSVYRHVDGTELVRTTEWSLPLHLHEHITTIQPTNSFMKIKKKAPTPKTTVEFDLASGRELAPYTPEVAGACNPESVTPGCLRTFYGTVNYTVQTKGEVQMGLCDYLGEINNRSDAGIYLSMFRPEAVSGAESFRQISIAGGITQQAPDNATQFEAGIGIEGNLDVETMLGIAWPLPLTAYSTGGRDPSFKPDAFTTSNFDEPYLTWLAYVLRQSGLPRVISTSYGDDEQTISKSYATAACRQFAQLGARGTTVLFASGDEGVGQDPFCFTNDGRNRSTFLPVFPAGCPYVTSVGATYMFNPEVAALETGFSSVVTSGGGFSNHFARPDYQKRAVERYLENNNYFPQYSGLFNPGGRGYPDIAAQGVNYSIVWNSTIIPVSGTSCASPTAAGVLALVNDALVAAGKPVLGFLNPWLYKKGYAAFNDILSGSSAGCNTSGFPAQEGWDAVTGFGSPVSFLSIVTERSRERG